MLLDKQLLFEDGLAMVVGTTGTVATHQSANALDLLQASPRQIGDGEPIRAFVHITTSFVGSGGTVNFRLINATLEALTGGTEAVVASTGAIAVASLVAGYQVVWTIPRSGLAHRYLGLDYVVGTAAMSAGVVTAGLIDGVDSLVKGAWTGVTSPAGGGWV